MQNKINKNLTSAFQFLFANFTYDLGHFFNVWTISKIPTKEFSDQFVDSIIRNMSEFTEQGPDGQASQFFDLILIVLDTLIFNMYTTLRATDKIKINNSLYGASVQSIPSPYEDPTFQGSVNLQPVEYYEFQWFFAAMERLLSNKQFFLDIQTLMSYNPIDQNMLQLSIFIDSLEYMAEKEGLSEEALNKYSKNREIIDEFIVEKQKMIEQDEIDQINEILFSKKLYKIKKILTVSNDTASQREVQFTILRIYFSAYSKSRTNFKRKQLSKIKYTGEDMMNTILKMYITNHNKRDSLFKETNQPEPILDFIINWFLLLFMPVYNQFQELFMNHVYLHCNKKPQDFFAAIQKSVMNDFLQFFEFLPKDLSNILAQISLNIRLAPHFTDNIPANYSITTLFINRFLLNPDIKLMLPNEPSFQIDNFLQAANLFKDLFYANSIKNYPNNKIFQTLSENLIKKFDLNTKFYDDSKSQDIFSYYYTDPALRNDYNYLWNYILLMKFNQIDEKELEISPFDPSLIEKKRKIDEVVRIQQQDRLIIEKQNKQDTKSDITLDKQIETKTDTKQEKKLLDKQFDLKLDVNLDQKPISSQQQQQQQQQQQYQQQQLQQQQQQQQQQKKKKNQVNLDQQIIDELLGNKVVEEYKKSENKVYLKQKYDNYIERQEKQYLQNFPIIVQIEKKDKQIQTDKKFATIEELQQLKNLLNQSQDQLQEFIDQNQQLQIQLDQSKRETQRQANLFQQIPKQQTRDFEAEERERQVWLDDNLKPYKKQIRDLEQKLDMQNKKYQEQIHNQSVQLNEKIEQKDKSIQQLQQNLSLVKNESESYRNQINIQNQQIEDMDEKIQKLQYELSKIFDERDMLSQQFDRLQQQNDLEQEVLKQAKQKKQNSFDHKDQQFQISQNKISPFSNIKSQADEEEFQQTIKQLALRKQELLQAQAIYEIHSRSIKR